MVDPTPTPAPKPTPVTTAVHAGNRLSGWVRDHAKIAAGIIVVLALGALFLLIRALFLLIK